MSAKLVDPQACYPAAGRPALRFDASTLDALFSQCSVTSLPLLSSANLSYSATSFGKVFRRPNEQRLCLCLYPPSSLRSVA
eukprot:427933-Pleurochrysis_carterae.AAC.1